MNKLTTAIASSAVMLLASAPAFANGAKITGGAERINAGGVIFSMAMNAIDTPKGVKGSIQYSREANNGAAELFVHAKAQCFWISDDGLRAVVAGPAEVQSGYQSNTWFFAAVREYGTGYGDQVRAGFINQAGGEAKCANGETNFPGLVEEGEFKIRPAD